MNGSRVRRHRSVVRPQVHRYHRPFLCEHDDVVTYDG
jgi:hypothetical protein